jgi:hypothetical protein
VDSFGRVLLEKGEALKSLYIKKLKAWKIEEIFVEEPEKEGEGVLKLTDEQLTEEIARIDKAFDAKFEGIEDARMLSIRRAARDFLVERLAARYASSTSTARDAPSTGKERLS